MHYKMEFVILRINCIGRKLENYRGRIGSDCQVYHSLHLVSGNSICLSSCLSFPDWFYWHTRTRYRDAIGALVFEWQYLRRPGFRTDRSMCFLNKKTIQDSQTRTENSANQILQLQWTKVKLIALNKSILKGLQFNKHFLTYCK